MAKSTKVQSTKVRNLLLSIPCIFCKFPPTLFAYIKYIFSWTATLQRATFKKVEKF